MPPSPPALRADRLDQAGSRGVDARFGVGRAAPAAASSAGRDRLVRRRVGRAKGRHGACIRGRG